MKRTIIILTAFVLVLLSKTAADARNESGPWRSLEEFNGRELTVEELEKANRELSHYKDGVPEQCTASVFLYIDFKEPDKIDMDGLLKNIYWEDMMTIVSREGREYEQIDAAAHFPDMYDIYKIGIDKVDRLLSDYVGLKAEELGADQGRLYFRAGDNYYFFCDQYRNRRILDNPRFIYGKTDGKTVMLVNEYIKNRSYTLTTLIKTDSGWRFAANETVAEEFQRNTYTENGWKMSIVYDKNVRPLPYDKRKGSRYNDAIKAYNEFIMSYRSYGKSIDTIVQEYNEASEERKSSYRFQKYGLADMNRDGIPELVVSKPLSVMQLFTYADGEVTSLECTTESGWHGFRGIMKSGYSRGNHVSTQNDWTFYKYNRDLSVETITFGVYWPPLYGDYVNSNLRYWETDLYTDLKLSLHMNGDSFGLYIFVFNGRVVSEREYQQLTKPYIDMTDSSYQVDCRYSQVGIADYEYPYFVKQENRHEFYAL